MIEDFQQQKPRIEEVPPAEPEPGAEPPAEPPDPEQDAPKASAKK